MKEQNTIDLNAHVIDLKCSVVVENNKASGIFSFRNLGYGIISAIKIDAKGYNSFDEEIFVDGKNEFTITLQDLYVPINKAISGLIVKLPNDEIRRIEVCEKQLVFEDGLIMTYSEPEIINYDIELLDVNNPSEAALLGLMKKFEKTAICLPSKIESGWVCVCGWLNRSERSVCSKCAHKQTETFELMKSPQFINLLNSPLSDEDLKVEKKKRSKRLASRIGVGVAIALLLFTGIGLAVTNNNDDQKNPKNTVQDATNGQPTVEATENETPEVTTQETNDNNSSNIEEPNDSGYNNDPSNGYGQDNRAAALDEAKWLIGIDYGFSRSELITELAYFSEGLYSLQDAEYAADNCGANWNEQAVKRVNGIIHYSREDVINTLVGTHGFTQSQAEYAATAVGY